jgi:hypothetical protein
MSIPTGSDTGKSSLRLQVLDRVRQRLKLLATSGLSPRSLALTLCIGGALGVLPLIWGTSFICLWLAHRCRLNHLVLQSVNYLLYPVQIALLVPFCKLGLWLVPFGPTVMPDQLSHLVQAGLSGTLWLVLWLTLKAVLAWLVTVPPVALLVYLLLLITVVKRREAALSVTVTDKQLGTV